MVLRARIIILWNIMFCNLCMRELVSLGKHFIKWEQVCAERVCTNTPPRTMYALHTRRHKKRNNSQVFGLFTSLGTTARNAGAARGLVKASATFSAEGRRCGVMTRWAVSSRE